VAPEHITERYGLFTIIVLGESILSASLAVTSLAVAGLTIELLGILFGGLVIVFVMWWLYWNVPCESERRPARASPGATATSPSGRPRQRWEPGWRWR
jgi:low temperature requirement protein LtrA